MLACVASGTLRMNFSKNRRQDLGTGAAIKLLPIHDFHEHNDSFIHISICIADVGIDVIIISVAQQRKPKFSNVRNSHRSSQTSSFPITSHRKTFPFFQNAALRFLLNTIIRSILTLFTNCKHRHQYYMGIILSFELRLFFIFFKSYVTSKCSAHEIWSLDRAFYSKYKSLWFHSWLRILRDKQFICRPLLLSIFNTTK